MKKLIVLFFVFLSIEVNSTSNEWKIIELSEMGVPVNPLEFISFNNMKALSDSTVWLDYEFGEGIVIYKNGNFRLLHEVWNYAEHHIIFNNFRDICENYKGTKWLTVDAHNDVKFVNIKNKYDTLIVPYPFPSRSDDGNSGPIKLCPSKGYLWITNADTGLVRFDGVNWEVFCYNNPLDSTELCSASSYSIVSDKDSNLWMSNYSGLLKFDGTNFTKYDTSNSGLPGNNVYSLAIDSEDNLWMAVSDSIYPHRGTCRLVKYDGTNWTIFDYNNSPWPSSNKFLSTVFIDKDDNIWSSSKLGLYKFDGTNWSVFDSTNSPLNGRSSFPITQDVYGNLWMRWEKGVILYNEAGVNLPGLISSVDDGDELPELTIAPNPVKEKVEIRFSTALRGDAELIISDIDGKVISSFTLKDGKYNNAFDINTANMTSGTYFVKLSSGNNVKTGKFVISR